MATSVLIPVSEYLASSYEIDCDYIEGELQERNVGEWEHGSLQAILARIFGNHRKAWCVNTAAETRVQVSERGFRIPDLCIMRAGDRVDRIVRTPPLICIEILSPEDRWARMQERIRDFQRMGVEHVWILDPLTHDAWVAKPDGTQLHVADTLDVPGTPIRLELAEVWAELADMHTGS